MLGTWRLNFAARPVNGWHGPGTPSLAVPSRHTEARQMTRVKQVGDRIEEILGYLQADDGKSAASAEELVGLLIGMYGDGLGRIVALLGEAGPMGTALLDT